MSSQSAEQRISAMGISLPKPVAPVAEYVPCKLVGDLLYVSGQGPIQAGLPLHVGRVGAEVTADEAYECARVCAVNALAAVRYLLGSLDDVREVVHVRGFVNSDPDFHDQPQVINGASEFLVQVFGESGKHARAALGTSNLPGNIPVEIEFVIRIGASCQESTDSSDE